MEVRQQFVNLLMCTNISKSNPGPRSSQCSFSYSPFLDIAASACCLSRAKNMPIRDMLAFSPVSVVCKKPVQSSVILHTPFLVFSFTPTTGKCGNYWDRSSIYQHVVLNGRDGCHAHQPAYLNVSYRKRPIYRAFGAKKQPERSSFLASRYPWKKI